MENLFNDNIVFIFFFAMIAIYNYTDLKEYQRLTIIYVSIYSLTILNLVSVKMSLLLLNISLFCFLEILTSDEKKLKILVNPIYKLLDFMYLSLFQYSVAWIIIAILLLDFKVPCYINCKINFFEVLSLLLVCLGITFTLRQKYIIKSFSEMYKVLEEFPIYKVDFNDKLKRASRILISLEDKRYFERKSYTFMSPIYIINVLKNKTINVKGMSRCKKVLRSGISFMRNIFNFKRGYSTLQMQLIRSIGIKIGYNCTCRRKIFEILYSRMFFHGVYKMLTGYKYDNLDKYKEYLIYIYFHEVNTFLDGVKFSKFLNAFDMKYDQKNEKDIYECSDEGIFIACMGLSNKTSFITPQNIYEFLPSEVYLDVDKILDMKKCMMSKPFNGNYLE